MKVSASSSSTVAAPVAAVWAAMHARDSLPRWVKGWSATGPSDQAGSRSELRTWFGRMTIQTIAIEPMVSTALEVRDSSWWARWFRTGRMIVAGELAPLTEGSCRLTVRVDLDVRPIRAAVSVLLITAVASFAGGYFGDSGATPWQAGDFAILAGACAVLGVVAGLVIASSVVGLSRLTAALQCKRSLTLTRMRAEDAPAWPTAPTG